MDREGFEDDSKVTDGRKFGPPPPIYKVWNPNPQRPEITPTPGIVMTTTRKVGEEKEKQSEVVQTVKAVILYRSHARQKSRGSGTSFRIECESHGYNLDETGDKMRPSLRVQQPLCRKVTAQDVAQVFSQWKGFDQAKVDAKVKEVTDGTGNLQVCGLKTSEGGFIPLCPKAKWDEDGNKPSCKPLLHIDCYDIERNRPFEMRLTGKSISNDKRFVSPFAEFFKFLRIQGEKGAPCFEYEVELSASKDGAYYYLNISKIKRIEDEGERVRMEHMALDARDAWHKKAAWVTKEQYEAQKAAGGAKTTEQEPEKPVSFEDDDIPF